MNIYHGTKKKYLDSILNNGFRINESSINEGRFGAGIYFGLNIKKAQEFSPENVIVLAEIDNKHILEIHYNSLINIYPNKNISWEEEEGIPELKEYILDKGYKAVIIHYNDGDSELVTYDESIVSNPILIS